MAEIVNLRRYRKEKAREEKMARAAERRAKSGRTKTLRRKQEKNADRAARDLDGKRREKEPE